MTVTQLPMVAEAEVVRQSLVQEAADRQSCMAVRMCYARAGEEEETVGQVRVAGVREEALLAARQEVAAVAATQAEEARDLRFHQDQLRPARLCAACRIQTALQGTRPQAAMFHAMVMEDILLAPAAMERFTSPIPSGISLCGGNARIISHPRVHARYDKGFDPGRVCGHKTTRYGMEARQGGDA